MRVVSPFHLARSLLALLAVAAAMAGLTAGPAQAARRPAAGAWAGSLSGGGSDPSHGRDVIALIALRARTRGRLDVWVSDVDGKCRGPAAVALFTLRGVKVAADGSFTRAGRVRDAAGEISFRLAGRFLGSGMAAGHLRLTLGACHMGQVSWHAADPAASGGTGRPRGGAAYAGYTSQPSRRIGVQLPITLRLSRSGQSVAGTMLWVNVSGSRPVLCSFQGGAWQLWFTRSFRERFTSSGHFRFPGPRKGEVSAGDITWGGRFGARKVTGFLRLTGTVKTRAGSVVARCGASLTWQAKRVSG
jgi:hypothetical protein